MRKDGPRGGQEKGPRYPGTPPLCPTTLPCPAPEASPRPLGEWAPGIDHADKTVWLPERYREEKRSNPLNTQPQAQSSGIRSSKPKVEGMQTEAHFGVFIPQLPKMVLSRPLLGHLVSRRRLPASDVNLGAGWISDIVHRPLRPSPPTPRCPSGNSSLSSKQFKKGLRLLCFTKY